MMIQPWSNGDLETSADAAITTEYSNISKHAEKAHSFHVGVSLLSTFYGKFFFKSAVL